MYRTTKAQRKNQERIEAWLRGEPFKENSRDKTPKVPDLSIERVLEEWVPSYDPKETGQFFTPLEMGKAFMRRAPIIETDARILEPCGGIGHLLYWLPSKDYVVNVFEASSECAALGRRLFPWASWREAIPFDHLEEIEGQYDYVVANPPFGTTWAMGPGLEMNEGRAKRSEHIFMELITRALKPGGQAAVIGPYNLVEKMPKAMRGWFDARMQMDDCWGPLPGEFALSPGMRVHAFYFTRLEEPSAEAAPVPVPEPLTSEGLSVVIEQQVLAEALVMVNGAAAKNAALPALRNVLLATENGRLKVQTNSLDLAMTTWITPEVIGHEGMIAAPAHFLSELVGLLPKRYVALAVGESGQRDMFGQWQTLRVQSGSYQSSVRGMAGEEFPVVKRPVGEKWIVPAEPLAAMLKQVAHYADAKGECGVPALGGVLFQVKNSELTVVASNRICLALSSGGMAMPDMEVVIPMSVLGALMKHLRRAETMEILLSASSVMFSLPDLEIVGYVMGDAFPDYTKVVPQGCQTEAVVNGGELLEMVNLARRFSEMGSVRLQVDNDDGGGRVTVMNGLADMGDYIGQLKAVVAGKPMELMFKGELLMKGLAALGREEVTIRLNGEDTPAVFLTGTSKQVVCPMMK